MKEKINLTIQKINHNKYKKMQHHAQNQQTSNIKYKYISRNFPNKKINLFFIQ